MKNLKKITKSTNLTIKGSNFLTVGNKFLGHCCRFYVNLTYLNRDYNLKGGTDFTSGYNVFQNLFLDTVDRELKKNNLRQA